MDTSKIINGTFLQVYLEGSLVGEAKGLQAKINFNKQDVQLCGQMSVGTKVTNWKGTGSLSMFKTNSRMSKLLASNLAGREVRFTIIGKLADPSAYGTERVALYGVSLDDLTLIDASAGNLGSVDAPFTFERYEYLDSITVR